MRAAQAAMMLCRVCLIQLRCSLRFPSGYVWILFWDFNLMKMHILSGSGQCQRIHSLDLQVFFIAAYSVCINGTVLGVLTVSTQVDFFLITLPVYRRTWVKWVIIRRWRWTNNMTLIRLHSSYTDFSDFSVPVHVSSSHRLVPSYNSPGG